MIFQIKGKNFKCLYNFSNINNKLKQKNLGVENHEEQVKRIFTKKKRSNNKKIHKFRNISFKEKNGHRKYKL